MADRREPTPHTQPTHEPRTARERAVARESDDLSPLRADELARNAAEVRERLAERGVRLTGGESSAELVMLLEAVERFERAVEDRGGDLMVDTSPAREPDDRHFVLPNREEGESVEDFLVRVDEATEQVRRHGPIA